MTPFFCETIELFSKSFVMGVECFIGPLTFQPVLELEPMLGFDIWPQKIFYGSHFSKPQINQSVQPVADSLIPGPGI